jgi:50S ribosomal protein L16 3-hydroxylase
MLAAIRWDRATVDRFVGCYLTEPKPQVFFTPPGRPLSLPRFSALIARRGLRLNPRTQLLYDDRHVYINGAPLAWSASRAAVLRRLANDRAIPSATPTTLELRRLLHGWYRDGFLEPG